MDQQNFSGFPSLILKVSLKIEPVESADHWEEQLMGKFLTKMGWIIALLL